MQIFSNESFIKLTEKLRAKDIKTGPGHDDHTEVSQITVLQEKKALFRGYDDGWGAGMNITYSSDEAERIVKSLINEFDIRKLLHQTDYNFYAKLEDITDALVCEVIAIHFLNEKTKSKVMASFKRKKDTHVIYGTFMNYKTLSWGSKWPLSKIAKADLPALQKHIDDVVTGLDKGEELFNKDYLISIGVKV